jgi:hypothetical protein
MNLLISTIGRSLFNRSFSKTLGTMGKRLIGRWDSKIVNSAQVHTVIGFIIVTINER